MVNILYGNIAYVLLVSYLASKTSNIRKEIIYALNRIEFPAISGIFEDINCRFLS